MPQKNNLTMITRYAISLEWIVVVNGTRWTRHVATALAESLVGDSDC